MSERDWASFLRKGHGTLAYVCSIPAFLNGYLGASSRRVFIAHDYAEKAISKHRLTPTHLSLMAKVVVQGEAIHDRPRHLTFFYMSHAHDRWFQVTVKRCNEKRELFITTFHGLGADDVRRRRKKHPTVWPLN